MPIAQKLETNIQRSLASFEKDVREKFGTPIQDVDGYNKERAAIDRLFGNGKRVELWHHGKDRQLAQWCLTEMERINSAAINQATPLISLPEVDLEAL
ncbi:MAG: hypothetical protein GJ676_13015 [Rhodobacteraceae bacterium]|nr:hypothetical protein [Paracoccaceae bacterium]